MYVSFRLTRPKRMTSMVSLPGVGRTSWELRLTHVRGTSFRAPAAMIESITMRKRAKILPATMPSAAPVGSMQGAISAQEPNSFRNQDRNQKVPAMAPTSESNARMQADALTFLSENGSGERQGHHVR
jgi:hypothetical protein